MRSVVTVGTVWRKQVEVVEARDGDAAGHRPAAALAFEQRADGQNVAGEEAGIDVGMGLHQADQRVGAFGEAAGRLEHQAGIGRQAKLLQRREIAAAALARAVVVAQRQGDEADALVAQPAEMAGHGARGVEVGVAHRHVDRLGRQVAGLDHRNVGAGQKLAQALGMGGVVQHQAADALRQQRRDQCLLVLQAMAGVGDHQVQAVGARHVGDGVDHGGVERVADRRHDQPDHVGALGRQAAGDAIGQVAELAHRGVDLAAHLVGHARRIAERARHRHRRDAGMARDVAHGDLAAAVASVARLAAVGLAGHPCPPL